jgi:hypothetical protein
VHRSRTDGIGESDLELAYLDSSGALTRLLIENKVSAGFQPRQAERYQDRAAIYLARGDCQRIATVLVAPSSYLGPSLKTYGFSRCLSYEEIRDWFAAEESLGDRRLYKVRLLEWAIDRAVLGYQPEADAAITDLWRSYWRLAVAAAAELEMEEPGAKPSGSTWIAFRPPPLPPGTYIVHKLERGQVDLWLPGRGAYLSRVREEFASLLERDMEVARASKSAAIRVQVPKIAIGAPLSTQESAVLAGLRAASRLLALYMAAHPVRSNHIS